MSYILDALRRADAERERERGTVPGLTTQTVLPLPQGGRAPPALRPWVWALAGCSVPLLGLVAWQLMDQDAGRQAADRAPPAASIASAALPAPPPIVALAPAPVPAAAAASATSVVNPRPLPRPDARPAGTAAAETRIYAQSELPADVRRQLPALVVSGSVYSARSVNRMLIVNGQAFREGDMVAPGLALDRIKLKSAVLRYKSYRFAISY